VVELLGLEDEGHGELFFTTIVDAGCKNADDGVRLAIDAHGRTYDFWIGAEMRPEFVGENDDVIFACDTFFGRKSRPRKKGRPNIL
jgi:hypothetical protein